MSVAVIIPFFGDDPLRRRNLQHVLAFYRDSFPDWLIQQIGKVNQEFRQIGRAHV